MDEDDIQGGQVILVFLFCLFTLLTMMLFPSSRVKKMATQHDISVLRRANVSLIAWAVSRYPGKEKAKNIRLGEMVMPDKDPPSVKKSTGVQDSTAGIGRLPWKTLGIPPLLDSHGEFLWYVVSGRYRDNGLHAKTLQCQNLRQLHIYSAIQAMPIMSEGIVAIVIAPHRPLLHQVRSTAPQQKLSRHYIEAPSAFASRQYHRHFIHGDVLGYGHLVGNDSLSAVMCHALERSVERRKEVMM